MQSASLFIYSALQRGKYQPPRSVMRQPHTRSRTQKDIEKPGRTGNRNPFVSQHQKSNLNSRDLTGPSEILRLQIRCCVLSESVVSEQRWHTNFYQLRECKLMICKWKPGILPELFARNWDFSKEYSISSSFLRNAV